MIDLHTHSTFSDGTYTPEALVEEAARVGLSALALTDHDTAGGLPRFLRAAERKKVRCVPGLEISTTFDNKAMHILGYMIRHDDPALNARLAWLREGRTVRNREILQRLEALGYKLTEEDVARSAGEDVVGRPHVARALVKHGFAKNEEEAFERFLIRGRPAYARRRHYSPEESIEIIRAAGGVAVLAHPYALRMATPALRKLLARLQEAGLGGLEVYYPLHPLPLQLELLELAKELGLVATGGSDFHGALKPDIQLGRGFGPLRVPDEVLEELYARKAA